MSKRHHFSIEGIQSGNLFYQVKSGGGGRYRKGDSTRFFLGGYHPTLKLSGIPTFTFIVSLTHRMDNI